MSKLSPESLELWRDTFARGIRKYAPPHFPLIVVLCGSTRFMGRYEQAIREQTLTGKIVLSVGMFGHIEGLDEAGETKAMLDELHLRKIDLADVVLVICPRCPKCAACGTQHPVPGAVGVLCQCGQVMTETAPYIGDSTRRETEYATRRGKQIHYLES